MANLRSITQTNPESIVYDERTKQYHDIANRYRMVKKSVAEAMRATVSSGAPTRGDETFVSQTTFDAFRKDVYFHISETARLTKIGLEELKKSFDYQTKETERLQRAVNRTDEETQEQNKIEKISDTPESQQRKRERRQNKRGMSMSSFLGLGAGGLLGAFLLASMVLTPEQHQQIGESIDESLREITSMVDTINRINDLIRPIAELLNGSSTSGATGSATNGAAIGRSMDAEMQFTPSATPAPATAPTTSAPTEAPSAEPSAAPSVAPPQPNPIPEPQNRSQLGAATSANASAGAPGTPIRIEENRDDPSFPHRAISSILLNNEENQRIDAMRRDPNIPESQFRDAVIDILSRRLQGQDVNTLAERIAAEIGSSPSIHNSAEVARNIITSINDGVGFNEAARRLYETFYHQDVTGGSTPTPSSNSTRSQALRDRLNRRIRQQETSIDPMSVRGARRIAGTFPTSGARVNVLPPILGPEPGGATRRYERQSEPVGTRIGYLQTRRNEASLDGAILMGRQATV